MDEDPLQRRIYFLTFIDSLDMIFSQYREKMTRQIHPQVMTLIHLRTVIIGVNDAKIRNIGKRIQSDYAQL